MLHFRANDVPRELETKVVEEDGLGFAGAADAVSPDVDSSGRGQPMRGAS